MTGKQEGKHRLNYNERRIIDDALKIAGEVGADGLYVFHKKGMNDQEFAESLKDGIPLITRHHVSYVRAQRFGPIFKRAVAPPPGASPATSAEIADLRAVTRSHAAEIRELQRFMAWMAESWCGLSGERMPAPAKANGADRQLSLGDVVKDALARRQP